MSSLRSYPMLELPAPEIVHEIVIDHQKIAWEQLSDMTDEELDSDFKLDRFFESIYVINLPNAKERLKRITRDLKAIGLRHFEVWKATNGRNPEEVPESIWSKMSLNWRNLDVTKPEGLKALQQQHKGEAGCFLSHYRLLCSIQASFEKACEELKEAFAAKDDAKIKRASAQARKYSSVLVMEDDNGFGIVDTSDYQSASTAGVGRLLREAMTELPEDWDMLYFMVQSYQPLSHTPHLKQLTWGTLMNAYAVSYRMYDDMIEQLRRIEDPEVTSLKPVDVEVAALHANHNCYAIMPAIAYQCEGTSQIVGWTTSALRQLQP